MEAFTTPAMAHVTSALAFLRENDNVASALAFLRANGNVTSALAFLRVNGIVPLSHDNWSIMTTYWRYFTLVAPIQVLTEWYPMGKTSTLSIFNLPGKPAWMFMELVSPITLLHTMYSVSRESSTPIPKTHMWLTCLFIMHYFHRAVLSPIYNPSMGPMHLLIVIMGIAFNLINGSSIGGWLGGYGDASHVPDWQVLLGSVMFLGGLWGNMYHEEVLRDIRRETEDASKATPDKNTVVSADGRVYKIPSGGLFEYVWHPHYTSEWIEWAGYMIAGGGPINFLPALLFLINEVATMIPRALQGKRWYEREFGTRTPKRKAAIPGLL